MSRSPFGWDLPPGCTQRHIDEAVGADISQLQEDVLGLLEDAGIPTDICDAIVRLVAEGEAALHPEQAEGTIEVP